MSTIKLIVGLGNPGAEYAQTRHNVGAWFIEELARQTSTTLRKETKFHGLIGKAMIDNHSCHLLQPSTYMNESGRAVNSVAKFYKIKMEEILVAHDELDFNAGTIRIKQNGGHGGHNGLRDIIQHLHGQQFCRMRIGIGHPGHKDRVTPYVLSKPSSHDRQLIDNALTDGLHVIPDLINGELEKAMRYLHNE